MSKVRVRRQSLRSGPLIHNLIVGGILNGAATEQWWIGRNARKIDAPPCRKFLATPLSCNALRPTFYPLILAQAITLLYKPNSPNYEGIRPPCRPVQRSAKVSSLVPKCPKTFRHQCRNVRTVRHWCRSVLWKLYGNFKHVHKSIQIEQKSLIIG